VFRLQVTDRSFCLIGPDFMKQGSQPEVGGGESMAGAERLVAAGHRTRVEGPLRACLATATIAAVCRHR
jgi:hypothetical protein